MKNMLRSLKNKALALHDDQQGASLIEYVLIIAVVALPLLGVIIWFRDEIRDWVVEAMDEVDDKRDMDP